MSNYIDSIVIPVPRANLGTYKRMSEEWGKAHLRHGALYYFDSFSDDVQPGKVTSFPQAVQLKDDEVIALAWVVYRSKEERDRISKAVMEDPQLKESMDPSKMPFDGKRMFWGGFETIIGPVVAQIPNDRSGRVVLRQLRRCTTAQVRDRPLNLDTLERQQRAPCCRTT